MSSSERTFFTQLLHRVKATGFWYVFPFSVQIFGRFGDYQEYIVLVFLGRRQEFLQKRRYICARLHGLTSQKTVTLIVTAVRTQNLSYSFWSHWRSQTVKKTLLFYICKLYICISVHRNSRLKKSNNMQQYADIYLLLNYSTCSGVHRAHHQEYIKLELQPLVQVTFEEACSPDSMICTRGCSSSFMYSWWWAQWTPEHVE